MVDVIDSWSYDLKIEKNFMNSDFLNDYINIYLMLILEFEPKISIGDLCMVFENDFCMYLI